MRIPALAAALVALCLAAPAAAQPDGSRILDDAVQQLAADLTEVEDYTFTVVHGGVRTPVYVYRFGQSWDVRIPETRLSDLLGMAVFWPSLLDPATGLAMDDAQYVREDRVDGRPTHVVSAMVGMDQAEDEVDSAFVFVDVESRQVVRIFVSAPVPEGVDASVVGQDAKMTIILDAGGHRETAGLLLPGELRVRMRMDTPNMAMEARQAVLDQIAAVRAQLQGSTDPEDLATLAVMDSYVQLLSPEGIDARMTVEDVVVNPGPPDWVDGEND